MRKLALLALVGLLPAQCVPTYAQTVGEEVSVRAACKDRALVERHIKWSQEDGNYDRANAQFLEAAMLGECAGLPPGLTAPIEEVGYRGAPFVDKDGGLVQFTAIKARGYWTMYMVILGREKKT